MNAHASYHSSNRTHSHRPAAKQSANRVGTPSVLSDRNQYQPSLISMERIWDPNLLDRLRAPLSRFAD
jgi:hypothetical protein